MMSRLAVHLVAFCLYAFLHVTLAAASPCAPVVPHDQPVPCGLRINLMAYVPEHALGSPQFVTSVADCANLCARRRFDSNYYDSFNSFYSQAFCTSFLYHPADGFCQLLGVPLADYDYSRDDTSETELYSFNCFDCGPECPQAFGVNLLDDGNFEKQLLGPWQAYDGSVVLGTHAKHMFECSTRNLEYSYDSLQSICRIKQSFNHCPGVLYALSFDYKIPFEQTGPRRLLAEYGFAKHTTTITAGKSDTSWKSFQGFFQGPDVNSETYRPDQGYNVLEIHFSHSIDSIAKDALYDLDNVRLVRSPTQLATKAGSKSVAANGGFEGSKLAPWHIANTRQASPMFTFISPGLGGSRKALKIFYHRHSGSSRVPIPLMYQMIATTPGIQYLLSFDYQSNEPSFLVALTGASAPGVTPTNYTESFFYPAIRRDKTYSATYPFVAYDSMMNLSISLSVETFSFINVSSVVIDNISVKPISKRIT